MSCDLSKLSLAQVALPTGAEVLSLSELVLVVRLEEQICCGLVLNISFLVAVQVCTQVTQQAQDATWSPTTSPRVLQLHSLVKQVLLVACLLT